MLCRHTDKIHTQMEIKLNSLSQASVGVQGFSKPLCFVCVEELRSVITLLLISKAG